MYKFRVWDKTNKKYLNELVLQTITSDGRLLIDGKEVSEDDYQVEPCTNFKSVDNQFIYVNDYIEFKLGLKMVRARVVYDNFGYWIYEIRGGCMVFNQQNYTIIGNQNTNPVNS